MRTAIALLAALAFTAGAAAAPPAISVSATPTTGVAPLRVTLTATGDAAAYTWDLGDGASATGAVVSHVYRPGRFVATVKASNDAGEVTQAQVAIAAAQRTLSLRGPASADYEAAGVLSGVLRPATRGAKVQIYRGKIHVATARVGAKGGFRAKLILRSPGPYHARYRTLRSAEETVRLRPRVVLSLATTAPVGTSLAVRPRLVPAAAGSLAVRVLRNGRAVASGKGVVRLPTRTPGMLRVEVTSKSRPGFAAVRRVLSSQIVLPSLARGARGPSVLVLERRLAELRYALRGIDSVYGHDTYEAVLAFQKVNGLPRTGRVEPALWRRLAVAVVPRAQRGGDYIEVDKSRQVLFVVRGGAVTKVVHVSTGATGNTPLGSWRVYRKVGGWDWVLWYPMYFKGGFAIHGYPSVPAYPASHGCVRIPMWIAPSLFGSHSSGTTIVVHL